MCPHVFFSYNPTFGALWPMLTFITPPCFDPPGSKRFLSSYPIPTAPLPTAASLSLLRPDPAKWTHAGTFLSTHSDIQTSAHCLQLHSPIALSMLCSYRQASFDPCSHPTAAKPFYYRLQFAPACLPEFVPPLEVAPRPVAFIVRSVEAAAWSFNYYGDQVAWPQTPVSRCLIDYLDSSLLTRRPSLSHSSFI